MMIVVIYTAEDVTQCCEYGDLKLVVRAATTSRYLASPCCRDRVVQKAPYNKQASNIHVLPFTIADYPHIYGFERYGRAKFRRYRAQNVYCNQQLQIFSSDVPRSRDGHTYEK
jgi:hypothetical protein